MFDRSPYRSKPSSGVETMIAISRKAQLPEYVFDENGEYWLLSPYKANRWEVSEDDSDITAELDFHFPMANGRCLTEIPQLLAAAKELTRLIRRRSTRKMSVRQHKEHHGNILVLLHAISIFRIRSLAELQYHEVMQLIGRIRAGTDGLLQSGQRVEAHLAQFYNKEQLPIIPYDKNGGLKIDRVAVLNGCHLPLTVLTSPPVARAFSRVEKTFGMRRHRVYSSGSSVVVTQPTANKFAVLLRAMYQYRGEMRCEALLFDPLIGEEANALIRTGKAVETTPIPPEYLTFGLLERATKLLVEEGEEIVSRHCAMSSSTTIVRGQETLRSYQTSVRRFALACFIIIASFTGRRLSEVLLLLRNCLTGNDGRGWWLHSVILKKGSPHYAWIPVPRLVARAVQLLLRLGTHLTAATEKDLLFSSHDFYLGRQVKLRPHIFLNKFAAEEGLANYKTETGEDAVWHWQTRQFRRFFAVIFLYRFGGSLEALSHALRHDNLDTTRGYLSLDGNLASIYRAEEYRFKRKVMSDIANDNGGYLGPAAKRLKRYSENVRRVLAKRITIMTPNEVDLMIKYADRQFMVIRPRAWVTCTCPDTVEATETAKCHGQPTETKVGPALENGGPNACGKGCPHALLNAANQNYLLKRAATECDSAGGEPKNLFEVFRKLNFATVERLANAGNAVRIGGK
ncbi:site-specific integrase [Rhizobium ruizarguesonis]|uniref:site-specific integrase n=1 Tax=Rhizobium ruizarguesonis TaxID=2081791 RepID=UPI001031CB25|nr:site-specific integrase [Rhizobium ruizarguesonis]TBF31483.1 site-specific integrase [Rhizobium ruizarguesonis]